MPKQPPSQFGLDNGEDGPLYLSWRISDEGGGFDLKSSPESTSAAAVIQIDFADLDRARRVLLGYPKVKFTPGGTPYISRCLPLYLPPSLASSPDSPGSPLLFARAITKTDLIGPRAGQTADGFPLYKFARQSLTFTRPQYHIHPDDDPNVMSTDFASPLVGHPDESNTRANGEFVRFVRRTTDPVDRTVTIPTAVMRWILEPADPGYSATPTAGPPPVGLGPPLLEAYGVQEPKVDVVFAHYERPELPLNRILTTMGAVNATAFAGFPARTLVCLAPRVRCYVGAHGADVYDVSFRCAFTAKVEGGVPPAVKTANHFLRAIKTAANTYQIRYRELSSTGTAAGDRVHRDVEFRDLFRPDA